jgi:hypothetical protein
MFSPMGWWKYRGTRVITCPENLEPAAVKLSDHLAIRQCSRWPEKEDCAQKCLSQIAAAPQDCLTDHLFAYWYSDRKCPYCGTVMTHAGLLDHKPALLGPDGRSVEWDEIPPEELVKIMATHRPVCWNCHIIENFIIDHPDLVGERNIRR